MNWESLPPFTEIFSEFRGTKIEKIFDDDKSADKIRIEMLKVGAIILKGIEGLFEKEEFRKILGSDTARNQFKKKHLFNLMREFCMGMEKLNELITETFGSEDVKQIFPKVLKYIIEGDKNFEKMLEACSQRHRNNET
jgi:hypothetical protein